jgi:phospholipase/carboxylesterase
MEENEVLMRLLAVLDALGGVARRLHPARLADLVSRLDDCDPMLREAIGVDQRQPATREEYWVAGTLALQACAGLRAAPDADNPMLDAHRALRQYHRALEALAALTETVPAVGHYFLEPQYRDDLRLRQRLTDAPHPDSGIFHFDNKTDERGGFSVYVPPWYDPARPAPVIFALHGGSGHGRLFLWNWIAEARSRGMIVVAPTAIGATWSLMEPETDCQNLKDILTRVRERWNIDPSRMLLAGMSDGGTFTLLSGMAEDSPFTHLAPTAASFHPLLLEMAEPQRLAGLPIHLTHGAEDWMFRVDAARTAHRALAAAGAAITYREIADLSHAYPREGQGEVLDWFMGPVSPHSA